MRDELVKRLRDTGLQSAAEAADLIEADGRRIAELEALLADREWQSENEMKRIAELEAQLAAERGAQSVNLSPPSTRRSPMTDELIEELARAIGQKIEGPAEDMDSTWYGKPLWKSYVEEAQAILPIIDRLTLAAKIEGAELMREAAAECITLPENDWEVFTIRALDAAAIVGGSHD